MISSFAAIRRAAGERMTREFGERLNQISRALLVHESPVRGRINSPIKGERPGYPRNMKPSILFLAASVTGGTTAARADAIRVTDGSVSRDSLASRAMSQSRLLAGAIRSLSPCSRPRCRWLELFIRAGEAVARKNPNDFAQAVRKLKRYPISLVAGPSSLPSHNFFTAK